MSIENSPAAESPIATSPGPGPVLVVAPHPDDEILGLGGTLLRHIAAGDPVHWLLMVRFREQDGYSQQFIIDRDREIEQVRQAMPFTALHRMELPDSRFETVPLVDSVDVIAQLVREVQPATVYLPYPGDAHTDHRYAFDAAAACVKTFRFPCVRSVRVYETLSETDFGLHPDRNGFSPQLFVDITGYLERKIEVLSLYTSEIFDHPFPRSADAIRAQATLRGAAAGVMAAECFQLLKEIR
ncbi:MAG: PIG-L deacetylase family protein [Acidobacteriota bacterium]